MWISLHYQHTDFSWPLSLEDKVTIFLDRTDGWQLEIADKCINDKVGPDGNVISRAIPGSGFAVLHIVLSYFEMIAKFQDGFVQKGKPGEYFRKGVFSVFPNLRNYPEGVVNELLDALYSGGRCGLYHGGTTDSRIIITGDLQSPIAYDVQNRKLIINPHRLVPSLRAHLKKYGEQLRDPNNKQLRENFERRFDYEETG